MLANVFLKLPLGVDFVRIQGIWNEVHPRVFLYFTITSIIP